MGTWTGGGALRAIDEYRTSDLGGYGRGDDKLLQRRCRDGVLRG